MEDSGEGSAFIEGVRNVLRQTFLSKHLIPHIQTFVKPLYPTYLPYLDSEVYIVCPNLSSFYAPHNYRQIWEIFYMFRNLFK